MLWRLRMTWQDDVGYFNLGSKHQKLTGLSFHSRMHRTPRSTALDKKVEVKATWQHTIIPNIIFLPPSSVKTLASFRLMKKRLWIWGYLDIYASNALRNWNHWPPKELYTYRTKFYTFPSDVGVGYHKVPQTWQWHNFKYQYNALLPNCPFSIVQKTSASVRGGPNIPEFERCKGMGGHGGFARGTCYPDIHPSVGYLTTSVRIICSWRDVTIKTYLFHGANAGEPGNHTLWAKNQDANKLPNPCVSQQPFTPHKHYRYLRIFENN